MENKEISSMKKIVISSPYPTIHPEVADEYVKNWEKGEYQIVPSTVKPALGQLQLNSFYFSIDDFEGLSILIKKYNNKNDIKITSVNCRIGLKPEKREKPDGTFLPYMYFEPILADRKRLPIVSFEDGCLSEEVFVSACYDFCHPCPPTCLIP